MIDKILKHPTFQAAQDINAICKPLQHLDITYFAHVHIDNDGLFSAINNNPQFMEHYLKHECYNVDVHTSKQCQLGPFIVWDAMDLAGGTKRMDNHAASMGVKHAFTIIDKKRDGHHYYHFANNSPLQSINQVYLSNIDLLKLFVEHFKEKVNESKIISSAYDIKFGIDPNTKGYEFCDSDLTISKFNREEFMSEIKNQSSDALLRRIQLSPQRQKCLTLLANGYSAKEIAAEMQVSPRTVDDYLDYLRKLFGCTSTRKLMAVLMNSSFGRV